MNINDIQTRFGIIGVSPAIKHVVERIDQVAPTDITVLFEGESGVGKEVLTKALHGLSRRRHKPLVTVNCGAIPEGLIESELFGAEKGAYTGSTEKRKGFFEEADNGTIFLDEIGEMPLLAQVRLLRVLESGEYSRVGSSVSQRVDVRVIAATNKNLEREVAAGRFREDLYYRLSTVLIQIPALRKRPEDIPLMFGRFLRDFSEKYNVPFKRIDAHAQQLLRQYRWPGNVRELRNVAERSIVLIKGDMVGVQDIEPFLRGVSAGEASAEIVMTSATNSAGDDSTNSRSQEIVYRALLELRMEIRDLKDQVGILVQGGAINGNMNGVMGQNDPFSQPQQGGAGNYPPLALPPAGGTFQPNYPNPNFQQPQFQQQPNFQAPAQAYEDYAYEVEEEEETVAPVWCISAKEALPTLQGAEKMLIAEALRRFNGNRRQTAETLGISERTLYRKIKEFEDELDL